jgi:hypothetical protein
VLYVLGTRTSLGRSVRTAHRGQPGDLNGDVEDDAVALLLASGGLTPMSD